MSSVKWFEGNSKEALKLMMERNCAFLVYIKKEDDEFTDAFNDPYVVELLNNQLVLCYEMDPTSQSFTNFKGIFNNVSVPSIYLLEKNNVQQLIIKKENIINTHELELEIKRQILNSVYFTIKCISDTTNDDIQKQKHVQYMTEINKKLQIFNNPTINKSIQKDAEKIKKLNINTKIKIKIPCEKITKVQEFQTKSTLNDVKTFVLNNFHLPEGPMKLIAHRQFVEEDFCQTLDALNLSPSSTIYVHIVPSYQGLSSIRNFQSWLFNIFSFTIMKPYHFFQYHVMNFIMPPPPVQTPRMPNRQEMSQTKTKSTSYKSGSNIYRLNTNESDDDENNTYNGNSTQQL
ncbi:UBX domain-containing protein 4-like [Sipha flava]|uniref:UBX domain-containing protein 4-like n=1 Tax=Sipha flava TaxID=143950 RepID=A0A8B8G925_9HEMI|nr:UBX domain-containing protein 4-like [Sipha flava]XP_025419373.1 UBX domain-containing protein 4-like [Sipha flava]